MNVFIDAWLERKEPVVFIRSREDGQALFRLEGEEIVNLLDDHGLCCDDLMSEIPHLYPLKELCSKRHPN